MTTMSRHLPGLDRSGDAGLTAALHTAVGLLTDRLTASVRPDGSVSGRCASRVLDSALALRLLQAEDHYPDRRERLSTYLRNAARRPDLSTYDRTLALAAVHGKVADGNQVVEDFLRDFDHFTSARKQLMLTACLAIIGPTDFPADLDADRIRPAEGNVHWVNLILRSLRIVVAYGQGRAAIVTREERDVLLALLGSRHEPPVWENNVTAHVLASLAAHLVAPGSTVVLDAIRRLLTCQNPDGGLPGIARLELFTTGPVGLALGRSGMADPVVSTRIGDYLAGQQATDGGWGFGQGTEQTDVDTTSYAVQCLRRIGGDRYDGTLAASTRYLAVMSGHDGGFPTYIRGGTPEIAMTAGATTALAGTGRHDDILRRAVRYLVDGQQVDGTFERSWSRSEANAMWRVTWALRSVPVRLLDAPLAAASRRAAERAGARLATTQNADGGWGHRPGDGSDVTSTAYSALAYLDGGLAAAHAPELRRAAGYLLDQLSADGGVSAPPDQVAPRPILFDAPVFTEAWALMALSGLRDAVLD
jgi:squalene-hopene/tetraprenyl-beta-curcumene cyclase